MNRRCKCGIRFKESRRKQKGGFTRVKIFCPDCDIGDVYDIYDWELEHEDAHFRRHRYEKMRK